MIRNSELFNVTDITNDNTIISRMVTTKVFVPADDQELSEYDDCDSDSMDGDVLDISAPEILLSDSDEDDDFPNTIETDLNSEAETSINSDEYVY